MDKLGLIDTGSTLVGSIIKQGARQFANTTFPSVKQVPAILNKNTAICETPLQSRYRSVSFQEPCCSQQNSLKVLAQENRLGSKGATSQGFVLPVLTRCEGLPVCKNWGFPWSCMLGNIFINNPEGVRHILKDEFQKYSKAIPSLDPFIIYFNEFMGSGIFTVLHGLGSVDNGQRWLQMRKTSAQMFNRKNFNTLMQEVFVTKADALREWLEGFADAEPVDIQKGFFNFTMDSIMNIFFGEDVSSQTGDHNPYGQAFDEAHEALFVHTVNSLAFNTFAMTLLPWPFGGAQGLARKFHDFASPMYWRFRKALRILDAEAHRMVQNCRIDASLSQRRDLLALFLQAEEEHGYSEGFLKEMVLNLIIAGRDTTACALSWMFVELARNPAVQSRLRDEIDEKLPSDANLDMQTLAHGKLPYLHGVLYETLRLWPPVPFDSKMTYADDVLPDGTQVSKGITVVFSPYILARDGEAQSPIFNF